MDGAPARPGRLNNEGPPTPLFRVSLGPKPWMAQFIARMRKVEAFMNSAAFAAKDGGRGLAGLAKDLKVRCMEVLERKGERIPH